MLCPKCQFANPEAMKFCGECGNSLIDLPKEIPPVEYSEPQSYTPKFLADKILTTRSSIEGERKLVTVLFADVANYTAMSEKLDPEEIHQIMDGCFKILMDEIHDHKGTINQFTGDGVMALFGAPLAVEDHAQDACLSALAIQKSIKQYSEKIEIKYRLKFQMRIGLNSGAVVVGSIGDDLRMDYTAIGDTTNLAARMENLAKPGSVIVSPATYNKVSQQFEFKSLGEAEVKGKENPLEIYELIKYKGHRPRLGLERQIFSAMVGRDNELNAIELQITKAITGEGSVVNIIGEAGIGKSRLVAELKNSSVMKRVTLLEGRAISIGKNLSFHPIISLIKQWAQLSEDDTEASSLSKLETAVRRICKEEAIEIIPFVATLMGMKLYGRYAERVKGIEGEALEKLIFKNVRDLLIKATELRPLVIVIEDLHWADISSIDLLEFLLRLAKTQRILFINIFRPDHRETGERIVKTINENLSVYSIDINLEPLTEKMSKTLIDKMLNIKGLHYGVTNKIIQRAGGNPFFLEEIVQSFIDEGAIIEKNGNFEATGKIETMVIPHTISDVLMARIDRLEDETRKLLKVASVIGRNFFYRILSEVAKTVKDIDKRLSYLKEIQLIRERERLEELEFIFKHALAQEAAYGSILHQKRKELHREVAKSIESIFKEKLHEFYGMLALHYSKGEDYVNAEHYLVKAGEEAIRSSASNETLNYYQEGLRIYLQYSKDAKDPEKLAMFEKNIAVALYNKSRWTEAVQHFNKVFEYWNIKISPNKLLIAILFAKNTITIMAGLNRLFKKTDNSLSQKNKELLNLFYKLCTALIFVDNFRAVFELLRAFNQTLKIGSLKSQDAINIILATAGGIAYSGMLFKFSNKLLDISKNKIDKNNIQNLTAFTIMYAALKACSGDWEKISSFEDALVNDAMKVGEFWNIAIYMWLYCLVKIEKGDNFATENMIDKLDEIGDTYAYDLAIINAAGLKTQLLLKRFHLSEARAEVDRLLTFSGLRSSVLHRLEFLGYKAEVCILLDEIDEANESILEAEKIYNQQKFVPSLFCVPYLIASFIIDIKLLRNAMLSEQKPQIKYLQKRANKSGRAALKKLKKYAPHRTKAFRLMGEYHWLIGKQLEAFEWWDKAISNGKEFGARPDLSRAYFEIGKALLEETCKFREWKGLAARDYLKNAKIMFEEIDLRYDLDELDKIASSN